MTARFAKLKQEWSLRGWTDIQWAAVNHANGKWFELPSSSFYVAEACDGGTDFESAAFLPEHLGFLELMISKGIAEPCPEGEAIESWQRYRKADNPFLKEIHWCVTGKCNLSCRHCYMEAPSGRYGELDFEKMLAFIDQFERANVGQVSLTGGEPFLRRDLVELMSVLADKRIRVTQIYTNGLLLTQNTLDQISATGLSPCFQVSFDGVRGHEYMRRRPGIEARVIEAIRQVQAAGFPVIVASNVDRVNRECVVDTYELLRDLRIDAWRIGTPLPMGNWRAADTSLSLEEEAETYELLLERWMGDSRPFEMVLGQFVRVSAKSARRIEKETGLPYTPEDYDCGSCRANPNLLPDGTLLPCPGYAGSILESHMPNMLTEDLSQAWANALLRSPANIKKRELLACNPQCNTCGLFGDCGTGCRASALRETGRLMSRDPVACELWKGQYRQRFRRLASEHL